MSDSFYNKPRKTTENPIARARIAKGMTQAQLAEAIGTSQKVMSQWEIGKVTIKLPVLMKIARVLDVDITELIPEEPKEQNESRIREVRLSKGLRQVDVAKCIGISKSQYSNYETGVAKVTESLLQKLAEVFEVDVETLK